MDENYRIISGSDVSQLGKRVNDAIKIGYTVAGGVCITSNAGGTTFIQAVIKRGR